MSGGCRCHTLLSDTALFCVLAHSPKVGNSQFAELFHSIVGRAWRVVNEHDEVCTAACIMKRKLGIRMPGPVIAFPNFL